MKKEKTIEQLVKKMNKEAKKIYNPKSLKEKIIRIIKNL